MRSIKSVKIFLPFLCLLLLSSCSKEVNSDKLLERDGVVYEINTTLPFTGISLVSTDKGLEGSVSYKEGKRDGVSEYFLGGKLSSTGSYLDGKRHGPHKIYYENDQLKQQINYWDDKEEGLRENYREDGQLSSKSHWRDGKLHGTSKWYWENGKLGDVRNYKDGKLDGLWTTYFSSGNIESEDCYITGEWVDMSYCEK